MRRTLANTRYWLSIHALERLERWSNAANLVVIVLNLITWPLSFGLHTPALKYMGPIGLALAAGFCVVLTLLKRHHYPYLIAHLRSRWLDWLTIIALLSGSGALTALALTK